MRGYKIGNLAARAGTNPPTIRYYEEIGLLRPADRARGGQRRYDDEDVRRLTIIRRCREFGFSVEQVRSLIAIQDLDRPCREADVISRAHLIAVREKLRELKSLEREITRFVERCEATCKGSTAQDCVMIEDLARERESTRATRKRRHRELIRQ